MKHSCCHVTLFLGLMTHTHLFISDRKARTDQNDYSTKFNLGSHRVNGITNGSMNAGLSAWAQMTQRQLNLWEAHPNMGGNSQPLQTWSSLHNWQGVPHALESLLGSLASSRQLSWPEFAPQQLFTVFLILHPQLSGMCEVCLPPESQESWEPTWFGFLLGGMFLLGGNGYQVAMLGDENEQAGWKEE